MSASLEIKPVINSKRACILVLEDDQWTRTTSREVLRVLDIKEGSCIYSSDQLDACINEIELTIAKERVFAALSRFQRTEQELYKILEEDGYPNGVIVDALLRVKELGYIDDLAYAQAFMRTKQLSGWGQIRIKGTLAKKGVPKDILEELDKEFSQSSEEETALSIISRFACETRKDKDRLLRKLVTKGYSFDVARTAVSRHAEACSHLKKMTLD